MKGIEIEVGLNGLTFGGDATCDVFVFNSPIPAITGFAKIVYVNGHYFLMNSSESPKLSFFKCINHPRMIRPGELDPARPHSRRPIHAGLGPAERHPVL